MTTTKKPRVVSPDSPATKEPNLFDLSSEGRLPALLRMLAVQIESGAATADSFAWNLSAERLEFTARLDLRPPHDK